MQQSVAEFNFSGINFSGKVGGNKEGRMQRHGGGRPQQTRDQWGARGEDDGGGDARGAGGADGGV